MGNENHGMFANSQDPASGIPKGSVLTLTDLKAAMKEYDFLVTFERELDIVKGIIDSYRNQDIEAEFREVKVNPDCLIATQMFVDKVEHEVIGRFVKSGLYTVPIVEEFHPDVTHQRYVLDGHNRSKWNAILGISPIDALEIYFPNGDMWTNYMKAAEAFGNRYVKYLSIGLPAEGL